MACRASNNTNSSDVYASYVNKSPTSPTRSKKRIKSIVFGKNRKDARDVSESKVETTVDGRDDTPSTASSAGNASSVTSTKSDRTNHSIGSDCVTVFAGNLTDGGKEVYPVFDDYDDELVAAIVVGGGDKGKIEKKKTTDCVSTNEEEVNTEITLDEVTEHPGDEEEEEDLLYELNTTLSGTAEIQLKSLKEYADEVLRDDKVSLWAKVRRGGKGQGAVEVKSASVFMPTPFVKSTSTTTTKTSKFQTNDTKEVVKSHVEPIVEETKADDANNSDRSEQRTTEAVFINTPKSTKKKKWREYIDPATGNSYFSNGSETTWDKPDKFVAAKVTRQAKDASAAKSDTSAVISSADEIKPAKEEMAELTRNIDEGLQAGVHVEMVEGPCDSSEAKTQKEESGVELTMSTTAASAKDPSSEKKDANSKLSISVQSHEKSDAASPQTFFKNIMQKLSISGGGKTEGSDSIFSGASNTDFRPQASTDISVSLPSDDSVFGSRGIKSVALQSADASVAASIASSVASLVPVYMKQSKPMNQQLQATSLEQRQRAYDHQVQRNEAGVPGLEDIQEEEQDAKESKSFFDVVSGMIAWPQPQPKAAASAGEKESKATEEKPVESKTVVDAETQRQFVRVFGKKMEDMPPQRELVWTYNGDGELTKRDSEVKFEEMEVGDGDVLVKVEVGTIFSLIILHCSNFSLCEHILCSISSFILNTGVNHHSTRLPKNSEAIRRTN